MSLPAPTQTALRGRWLALARAAWVIIATLASGLFFASIPGYVSDVLDLGRSGWMGAPVEAPAGLVFALGLLGVLASVTAALVCLTLAVALFRRRSDDLMAVFTSSYLLLYGTIMAGPLEWAEAFYLAWPSLAVNVIQPLFFTTPTVALFVLFPDGRPVPRWTRWLVLFSVPSAMLYLYLPLAYSWILAGMIVIVALYAQIYRYRYVSTSTGQQQTKWVLFGILLWWLLMAMLSVPYALELNLPSGSPLPWWTLVGSAGWWLSLTIIPFSLSVAVLRYRLYDIDLVINRALVYGALTLTLVGIYFGSVVTLQRIFVLLVGESSQIVIVASTLVIAALFNPLRRRIQSLVARRFYRSKYDAVKTLEDFSKRLRDETDLDRLGQAMVSVARETVQPVHVSLWLREPERGKAGR